MSQNLQTESTLAPTLWQRLLATSLVTRIVIAIVLGVLLGVAAPGAAMLSGMLGTLFVSALKAIAPLLVFVLIVASLACQSDNSQSRLTHVVVLYLLGTLAAAVVAVGISFAFPSTLELVASDSDIAPPKGIGEVFQGVLLRIVDNPVNALVTGNFIGILAWAVGLGLVFRNSTDSTRHMLHDVSEAVSHLVKVVIHLAPLGIFGLVAKLIAETGFSALWGYAHLLAVLLGAMLLVALVMNPLIVFLMTRRNPYPLVFACLRNSGITAFFTRSSAANIPVNMELCHGLRLHEDTYSVSVPLGATINMSGAAITITVLTLAAANTLGIEVDLMSALLLSLVSALSACGASGVAGGSLLLIPLAASLFGIDNDVAMQVVGVGFIIGVVQDSAETALNSSTDVVFTAAASHTGAGQSWELPLIDD